MSIHYLIKPVNPNAHLFEVRLSVDEPSEAGHIVSLPNWIPGSYMIRDFSRNIVWIRATSAGQDIPLQKLDKSRWQAPPVSAALEIVYEVYAWDLSVRAAHLDAGHGFFNGTSVFLCVDGAEDKAVDIRILPPDGESFDDWRLASSLTQTNVDARGFGDYRAESYDELIDHPVEMGTFTRVGFEACGVPHEVILTGRFEADLERLAADLKTICEYHINFFASPAPMEKYLFLVMVVGEGYGGLEHRASTSLLVSRKNLPAPGLAEINDDYLEFLGLCSHEYFHTWNVKRIKPAVFIPYRLQRESYTSLLWAFEGITSYYDDLALVRSGLIEQKTYLKLLGKMITRVYRGSGRLKQSVADSSFDAWTKFYKQDENSPNAVVSYYAKGAVVALLLDCEMRKRSAGNVCLDDLMLRLWNDWRESGGKGVDDAGIEELVSELTGESLRDFFDRAVRSTEDLPLTEALKVLGVQDNWRAALSRTDAGGTAKKKKKQQLTLGLKCKPHPKGFEVTHVLDGGAAQAGGLAAGDQVIALDGYATDPAEMDAILSRRNDGDELAVNYFRHGELRKTSLRIKVAPKDTCWLSVLDNGQALCDDWLSGRKRR
ncbi:MAG: M61 family metallopeptidase [Gammaproteobacteria bacterium]|nr:M61 family metallopeptidase [Gammaproteobacteria bacterium]